eukprot:scaffold48691_cov35-Tisochrysis_lutea.AAC.4
MGSAVPPPACQAARDSNPLLKVLKGQQRLPRLLHALRLLPCGVSVEGHTRATVRHPRPASVCLCAFLLTLFLLSPAQIRSRARAALLRFTASALEELRTGAGDGALRGADWSAVARFVDLEQTLDQ